MGGHPRNSLSIQLQVLDDVAKLLGGQPESTGRGHEGSLHFLSRLEVGLADHHVSAAEHADYQGVAFRLNEALDSFVPLDDQLCPLEAVRKFRGWFQHGLQDNFA